MTSPFPVYVVDDDPHVRELLCMLSQERGLSCRSFNDGETFLAAVDGLSPGCVLLDMRLPRRSGLQVQAELATRGHDLPVIAITGFGYVDMAVESMKLGAVDFIEKPFDNDVLFDALDRAIAKLQGLGASSHPEG